MSTDGEPPPKKQKRSRAGCLTCRSDKKKCDEERPHCGRCVKMNYDCVWPHETNDKPEQRWRPPRRRLNLPTAPVSPFLPDSSDAGPPLRPYPDERAWISALPVLPSPIHIVSDTQHAGEVSGPNDLPLSPSHMPVPPAPQTVLSEGELLDLLKGLPRCAR